VRGELIIHNGGGFGLSAFVCVCVIFEWGVFCVRENNLCELS
jgi:hypothetical protein